MTPLSSLNKRRKQVIERMNELYESNPKDFPEQDCSMGDFLLKSPVAKHFEAGLLERFLDENMSTVLKMVFVGKAADMSSHMMLGRNFKAIKAPAPVDLTVPTADWEPNDITN